MSKPLQETLLSEVHRKLMDIRKNCLHRVCELLKPVNPDDFPKDIIDARLWKGQYEVDYKSALEAIDILEELAYWVGQTLEVSDRTNYVILGIVNRLLDRITISSGTAYCEVAPEQLRNDIHFLRRYTMQLAGELRRFELRKEVEEIFGEKTVKDRFKPVMYIGVSKKCPYCKQMFASKVFHKFLRYVQEVKKIPTKMVDISEPEGYMITQGLAGLLVEEVRTPFIFYKGKYIDRESGLSFSSLYELIFKVFEEAPSVADIEGTAFPKRISMEESKATVIARIQNSGGTMEQMELVRRSGFSKGYISFLLSHLEKEGLIKKTKFGKKNVVLLVKA